MPGWDGVLASIGPVFDMALATRDGSNVACLNRDGASIDISKLAFMQIPGQAMEESTDLQRKDELTRLSSPNVIDRDYTLTPQVSQGVWSGGEGQKVYTDPTRYYQGRGIILPGTQVAPSMAGSPINLRSMTGQVLNPMASGFLTNANNILVYGGAPAGGGSISHWIEGNGVSATTVAPHQPGGYVFISGHLYGFSLTATAFVELTYTAGVLTETARGNVPASPQGIVSAYVGANAYMAIWYAVAGQAINIYDVTNFAAPLNTTIAVNIPPGSLVTSAAFSGSTLYYMVTDGENASLIAYSIPGASYITVAQFRGVNWAQLADVAGTLVVLTQQPVGTVATSVDLYTLISGTLAFVSTLAPFLLVAAGGAPTYASALLTSNIAVFNQYAIFGVAISATKMVVLAYDVTNGRIFRLTDQPNGSVYVSGYFPPIMPSVAVVEGLGSTSALLSNALAGLATYSIGDGSGGAGKVQLQPIGVYINQLKAPTGQVVSSLIDFTSAQKKLYRRIIVDHDPILAGSSVSIAVFVDQDPDNLTAANFAVTHSFSGTDTNPSQTALNLNVVARKIVYQLDYVAVRPQAVKVQTATGWVWRFWLAIGNTVQTNNASGGNDQACYQSQQVDSVIAYNFLRQLWRLKTGECLLYPPNGDAITAVIEEVKSTSNKPLGQQGIGSVQKPAYETTIELLVREDV